MQSTVSSGSIMSLLPTSHPPCPREPSSLCLYDSKGIRWKHWPNLDFPATSQDGAAFTSPAGGVCITRQEGKDTWGRKMVQVNLRYLWEMRNEFVSETELGCILFQMGRLRPTCLLRLLVRCSLWARGTFQVPVLPLQH